MRSTKSAEWERGNDHNLHTGVRLDWHQRRCHGPADLDRLDTEDKVSDLHPIDTASEADLKLLRRVVLETAESMKQWFVAQEFGDGHIQITVLVGLAAAIMRGEIRHLGLAS